MTFLCYSLALFVVGGVFARAPIIVRRPHPPAPKTCTYEGKTYHGRFRPSACVHCHCDRGEAMCMSAACAPPPCVDAEFRTDVCCPVCPNGENCAHVQGDKKTIIKKGETYRPDPYTECHCPENLHYAPGGPGALCIAERAFARAPIKVHQAHPAPKTCTYEGKTYHGRFQPSACVHCHCDRGEAMCMSAACAPPLCVDAEFRPDVCCPVCPNGENCVHVQGKKKTIIKKGETYRPDPYTECHCPENVYGFGPDGPGALCIVERRPEEMTFINYAQ